MSCVSFESVEPDECCLTGCNVVRTVSEIPIPVTSKQGLTITGVYSVFPYEKAFDFISYDRIIFSGNGRFTSNNVFSFYYKGKVYLRSKDDFVHSITKGNIRGVFEDPTEAANIIGCDELACYNDDMVYPITRKCEAHITKLVLENLIPKLKEDKINDATSNIE